MPTADARSSSSAAPDREPEQDRRGEQPQQRVALQQPALAHELEHEHEQARGDEDGEQLQARDVHQIPCSAATGALSPGSGTGRRAAEADDDGEQHLDHVVDRARRVDRGDTADAMAHDDGDLHAREPVVVHEQHRLDLGVVVRIVAGEQLDAAAAGHAQAGRRVGHALADDRREDGGEDADAHAARHGGSVAVPVGGEEARARDHVELRVVAQVPQQRVHAGGVVLAVAVDLHGGVVAALERVDVAGLHGAADAEVERVAEHLRARRGRARSGVVGRAVVDHEHVELGRALAQLAHDVADRVGLVVGRNDREMALHGRRHQRGNPPEVASSQGNAPSRLRAACRPPHAHPVAGARAGCGPCRSSWRWSCSVRSS